MPLRLVVFDVGETLIDAGRPAATHAPMRLETLTALPDTLEGLTR